MYRKYYTTLSVEGYTKAVDTLRGTEKDFMKYGNYVSPEKREMYKKMMKGAKDKALDYSFEGLFTHGPAGVALGIPGGSVGMLQGLWGAVRDQDKPQNEAAEKAEDHFRDQRDKITDEYFDKLKNNYRK